MQNVITSQNQSSSKIGSDITTDGIRVQVFPEYIPEQSNPAENRYEFSYKVIITNSGNKKVKLLYRHWIIINAEGDLEKVEGPGVVGYTPELEPGESFEYRSQCPLNTNWGTMEGNYTMLLDDGSRFEAVIDRFYLVSDEVLA